MKDDATEKEQRSGWFGSAAWTAIDAPMYNVMGQQVDKTYKGVVIQNGHKFMLQ